MLGVSRRKGAAVKAIKWAWRFQRDVREAYVWHRRTGERRRLRLVACAWRTALILTPWPTQDLGNSEPPNTSTIAGIKWYPAPKDGAWPQSYVAMVEKLAKHVRLRCHAMRFPHTVMVAPRAFTQRHGLAMVTRLLTISRRRSCKGCGTRKGGCRPAPLEHTPRLTAAR